MPSRAPIFVWQDLRYAVRLLRRTPVFTAMTVLVLAGGLGISIFTYSFLWTAMVAPLPLDGGAEIVRLSAVRPEGGTAPIDAVDLARLRPGITSLTGVGAFVNRSLTVGTDQTGWSLTATAAEWSLFATTRTRPLLGRTLTVSDQEPGADPVIVLSYRTWKAGFGGDSSIVGRRIDLNRVPTLVVGVMLPRFEFPVASEAWVPIDRVLLDPNGPGGNQVEGFARLAPGVSRERAAAELSVLLARVQTQRPERAEDERRAVGIAVETFPMAQVGELASFTLILLNGLAALILFLACVNVGNLLLARANERQREMAVRLALGAARPRLVMQHLWESIILCVAGGALATALAVGGLDLIDAWSHAHLEGNLAFWWRWGFDRSLLLAAGGFVTLAIAVLGGAVSLRATSGQFLETLRAGAQPTEGRAQGRWSRALVIIQIAAVSVVMFVGVVSGIVIDRVLDFAPGFDTTRLIRTQLELPSERYPNAGSVTAARLGLANTLAARPEVESVLFQTALADIAGTDAWIEVAGQPVRPANGPRAYLFAVQGPLSTLGIPVRPGRQLETADGPDGAPVVVVSQALAGRLWPDGSPIGRQLRLAGLEGAAAPWRTVVGVAGDVPYGQPLSRDRSPLAAYLPLGQIDRRGVDLLVKYRGGEAAARAAIVSAVAAADPLVMLPRPISYQETLEKSSMVATGTARMFGGCFVFALLLAISGTYGLVARSIVRRTREIGIRRALGASDGMVLRLLVWQSGKQLGVGALVAIPITGAGALAVSTVLPIGPALAVGTAIGVALFVVVVVFAATWLPTRRAIRTEPRDALFREG